MIKIEDIMIDIIKRDGLSRVGKVFTLINMLSREEQEALCKELNRSFREE